MQLSTSILLFLSTLLTASANPVPAPLDNPVTAGMWEFEGYQASETCRSNALNGGSTRAGSNRATGCTPTTASAAVTKYSYDGTGTWKLCLYNNAQCTNPESTSVNGGRVVCLDAANVIAYKVIAVDAAC